MPRPDPEEAAEADRRHAVALVPVSRETEERLALYVALLRRWQRIKNLVGPSTLDRVWTRHIADSAQLVALLPEARSWLDMGSGAGFPGLVIAILLRDTAGAAVHLVESNARKCAFLREAARETGAAAVIHNARIENVTPTLEYVDVITARALAPLPDLLEMGKIPLSRGATGLFLKSAGELASIGVGQPASIVSVLPSLTSPEGRVVLVRPGHRAARD